MRNLTNYEYQTQVDRMTEILRDAPGWGDAFDSSTGQRLIRLMADVTDNLHFMLERRTLENYLLRAKTRNAILTRANEKGYRAKRAIASQGTIEVTITEEATAQINVPAFTEISFGGNPYVLIDDLIIPSGETTATVRVKQGTIGTRVFEQSETSFVENNSVVFEEFEDIDNDIFYVFSDGVEFLDVTKRVDGTPERRALSFVRSDDPFYDIRFSNEGMRVIFGNNDFGLRPSGPIEITYVEVDQDITPLLTLSNEFDFGNLEDVLGNVYDYSAINITPIRGAREAENNQSIVENAIAYHKTNGRAVTNDDFNFWVKEAGVGNIIDVKTSGEYELDSTVYNMNNVYITYLTEEGDNLTVEEQRLLRRYMDVLKIVTSHLVLRPADQLLVELDVSPRKKPNVPISNSELYAIIYEFLIDYFSLTEGSIGREIQQSDIIRDMYELTVERQGITYNVLDFVRLDMYALYPFETPLRTSDLFIELDPAYSPQNNEEFVIVLDNLPCVVETNETMSIENVLTEMRDRIMEVTPYPARVELAGVAVDGFGNPVPVEIDTAIGSNLMIGIDTPYFSPTDLVGSPVVGSSSVRVVTLSDAIDVEHYYYSSPTGRRPLIPLRIGTTVSLTAPTDTNVNVYTRVVMADTSTETQVATILAGEVYTQTFNGEHSVQFEYVNDSSEDVVVAINYPDFEGTALGLRISSPDSFGRFNVSTASGDISQFVTANFDLTVPPKTRIVDADVRNIRPSTLTITNRMGNTIYTARPDGFFEDTSGNILVSGRVDYNSGTITLPDNIPDGEYYIRYQQDQWQNLATDDTAALVLIPPKPRLTSSAQSVSRISVE